VLLIEAGGIDDIIAMNVGEFSRWKALSVHDRSTKLHLENSPTVSWR